MIMLPEIIAVRILLFLAALLSFLQKSSTSQAAWVLGGDSNNRAAGKALLQQGGQIRVRRTLEDDIPAVSSFLATTASSQEPKKNMNWKQKMDQLFAKNDIESLLRQRHHVLQLGYQAHRRVHDLLLEGQDNNDVTEEQRLAYLWNTSDQFKHEIAQAAAATAERSIWKSHNMALTPASSQWLNHLQMTATVLDDDHHDITTVGFCEMAMLSNPCDDIDSEEEGCLAVGLLRDEEDNVANNLGYYYFSPAITNLAVAPDYRREGIGRKLLQVAERYAQIYWKSTSMGLYVECDNVAALNLYEKKCNYEKVVKIIESSNDHHHAAAVQGDMWYMRKCLSNKQQPATKNADDDARGTTETLAAIINQR